MTADELKALIDEWQQAMRRYGYLQAMREVLQPGPAADALDEQLATTKAQVERLQKAILGDGPTET